MLTKRIIPCLDVKSGRGNVTLHSDDAPQRSDSLKSLTAL